MMVFSAMPSIEGDREGLLIETDAAIDLVGENDEVVVAHDLRNLANIGFRDQPPGRILRRVEHQDLGARRNFLSQLSDIQRKTPLFDQRQRHGRRPAESDHRFVDRKTWVLVEDFVSRLEQRQEGEEEDGLAAGRNDDLFLADRNAAGFGNVPCDDLAQVPDRPGSGRTWCDRRRAPGGPPRRCSRASGKSGSPISMWMMERP